MADDTIRKLYYSISEVGELLDLEPHVLRYWEGEFEQLKPRKNRAGRRAYTDDDIAVARRIQYLLKESKYTIDGARQRLARDEGTASDDVRRLLLDVRHLLVGLRRQL